MQPVPQNPGQLKARGRGDQGWGCKLGRAVGGFDRGRERAFISHSCNALPCCHYLKGHHPPKMAQSLNLDSQAPALKLHLAVTAPKSDL